MSMGIEKAEEVYEIARRLPVGERLKLVERIAHDLIPMAEGSRVRYRWMDIQGIAPNCLEMDAQEWVSRSREEADRGRSGLGVDRDEGD